ncbi:MAG: winged helix-turn-helix transcriptional regulator [Candidatus Bathyarchaeia archaeon]
MFLTVKQKILVILLEKGPLQNNEIAKKAGITEQWCSETINALHEEGLIESQFIAPRRINKLTNRGVEVAKHLKEISESTTNLKTEVKMLRSYSKIRA